MINKKFYVLALAAVMMLFVNVKSNAESLHEICEFGSFSEIKEAIKAGANVNEKDEKGRTPLMAACEADSSHEIIQLLISFGALVNEKDNDGKTAIMYAAQYNKYPRVTIELIKAGGKVNTKSNDGSNEIPITIGRKILETENIIKFIPDDKEIKVV